MNQNPTATALVRRLFLESLTELLQAYGLTERIRDDSAERSPTAVHRESYVSVLSLTADGLLILSTLDFDIELLASLYPARAQSAGGSIAAVDLEDWCRELNNQLGGRLKNKLLERGSNLVIGLPALLTGVDISSIANDDMDMYQVAYVSAGRRMIATLSTQIAAETKLTETAPDAGDILREGAIALF
jgi:hypothetical protein